MDATFANRLRSVRAEKNLTQQQTAVALGVSLGTVARWETGRAPDTSCVIKLAEYFDVSIDWLLLGRGQKRLRKSA